MVAVFNKELLSWYLITLKLKETVEAGLPKSQPSTPTPSTQQPHPPLLPPLLLPQSPSQETQHNNDTTTLPPNGPNPSPTPKDSWLISIQENLTQAQLYDSSSPWSKHSIYRVPKSLRDGDDKSYVPQLVSIGPYHHSKRRFRDMDRHKWRSLHHVLRRTSHPINLYLNSLHPLEDRARSCYDSPIPLPSPDFLLMLLLDGCFLLELFRGSAGEGFKALGYSRHDPIFAMRGTMHSLQRDMIMLENQIPLFILDRLYGLQLNQPDQTGLVARLAIRFFDPLIPTDEPLRSRDRSKLHLDPAFDPLSDTGLHCLDVFRQSLLRTGIQPAPRPWLKRWSNNRRCVADKRRQQLIHCVSELREAGVKFKKLKTDRFWDIKFHNGVLKIPRLLIHDGTRSLFLNLIAFEQCHMDSKKDITSYVVFMDNLINSADDVGYLHYCGIIEHWLGNDDEVAELFNKLCQEVVFDINDSYLSGLSDQVNRYYNHRWNAWRASLKHNYFSNPWAIISLVAAVVLLVLTFAQTFYSVYGYYWPRS
ncbi:beta-sandwich domain of Sec23/24 domain-containing protein [Dioscorea alata]|uniref:Beta-sandwich domain of Sec23/24 domain-containing protein n=1 Tax=Dioscorea alata TaxID=55571 RepID=A0ACB7WL41_DIOAL|nr:beta-sandwich domain of Sec23/24 domain-containing protein [Dioscorea alata]